MKLKEDMDAAAEGLFSRTIWPCDNLSKDDLENNIPNRRGVHFFCFDCKSKLFTGKMPPKCHQNKLEVFGSERSLRGADVVGGWVCQHYALKLI